MGRDSLAENIARSHQARKAPITREEVRSFGLGVRIGMSDRLQLNPAKSYGILRHAHPYPGPSDHWAIRGAYAAGLVLGFTRGVALPDLDRQLWRGDAQSARSDERILRVAAMAGFKVDPAE